ncbi:MAG: hypothetical protein A3J28_16465 [Acidobacteria bacterium RIFCSPLOWO2_12_FULL_60_22]|nr:MAG: hypothetical protein A3J28_16465 [Acidobacteria bacterium RIFCSPLOWO2_12_FULL_60_22]
MAHCPECESVVEIEVDDVEEGQIVTCPECGVDLEVVNTNPIELDLAEDEDLEEEDEEGEEEIEGEEEE